MILMVVAYIITTIISNKLVNRFILEGQIIEVAWTIAPAVILIFIAIPSLRLLYLIDEIQTPSITLKIIGHQ
jgi:cytochrome c oxidase subunit 2